MTKPSADEARLKRMRKTRDDLMGIRKEIRVMHRLARRAMRMGDMRALRVGLDAERAVIERFAAIIDKPVGILCALREYGAAASWLLGVPS